MYAEGPVLQICHAGAQVSAYDCFQPAVEPGVQVAWLVMIIATQMIIASVQERSMLVNTPKTSI